MPFYPLKFLCAIISALILAWSYVTFALADGPGDLDITFHGDGIVTTSVGNELDIGDAVAVQADGKVVVAGVTNAVFMPTFTVTRYDQNGNLDPGLNGTGVVTTSVGQTHDMQAVALQSDQKIVLVGRSLDAGLNASRIAVIRYNPDGSLDSDFKGTGIVTTSLGAHSGANAVAVTNGKIVVAGWDSSGSLAAVRYNDDGTLDSSFNGSGVVTTSIGTFSMGYDLAVQPDGKIVVAGITSDGVDNDDLAVARYNPDGSLDSDFNGTGVVTTALTTGHDRGYGVALQPDGKIVVAGETPIGENASILIVRYTISGALDTTLNGTGIVTTPVGQDNTAIGVVIQPNNKIVVGGVTANNGKSYFAVVHYNGVGSLDTTFKGTGIVTTSIGLNSITARAIAIQPDGKLLVAGFRYLGNLKSEIVAARYLGDDTSDDTAPAVASSLRVGVSPTRAANVKFIVTFTEPVTGVDVTDFSLSTTGTISGAAINDVNGSGMTYTVTVNTGNGEGTIRLDVVDNDSIVDAASNPLGGSGAGNGAFTNGEAYLVLLYRTRFPLILRN